MSQARHYWVHLKAALIEFTFDHLGSEQFFQGIKNVARTQKGYEMPWDPIFILLEKNINFFQSVNIAEFFNHRHLLKVYNVSIYFATCLIHMSLLQCIVLLQKHYAVCVHKF